MTNHQIHTNASGWLLALLLCLPLLAHAADGRNLGLRESGAGKRVALVIGNDHYGSVPVLRNAVADARSMAAALEKAGFDVTLKTDANLGAMKQAVRQFKARLSGGDEAIFFYSGHGVQLGAANYLLPVDITSDGEEQVKDDAIPLQRLLDDLQDQKVKFALAIIDACRDNPFKGSGRSIGGTRGLAPTSAANGQMVIFSAGAGQQALDKLGNTDREENGVFTRVFLQEMQKPGVEVHQVLRNVRSRVVQMAKSVNHDQMPALYDQVEGDFYFQPGSGTQIASLVPVPAPAGGGVSLDDIKKQQEARAQWDKWQAGMKADFDKIAALNAEPDLQVAAWDRFLASYAQDNPYSAEDKQLRAQAQSRKQAAQAQQQQAAARLEQQKQEAERQRQQAERQQQQAVQVADKPGQTFRDCPDCAEMVVIPAGNFMMGSPGSEADRFDKEGPLHEVNVARFALGKYEVTVGEFRRFAQSTNYRTDAEKNAGNVSGCYAWDASDGKSDWRTGRYWDNPGFSQTERQPVVCVSWNDAQAYTQWLAKETGKKYRLPSEAEWEYAARAGTATARYWGDDPNQACRYANVADTTKGPGGMGWPNKHECSDGYFFTAPVGSFVPNAFGLYDMIGNAWEWTQDYWHDSYAGAPTDGSAWTVGDGAKRVLRGGSWNNKPQFARAAKRSGVEPANRFNHSGFRLARMLP